MNEMKYSDYSYRHGKEILGVCHHDILVQVDSILKDNPPYPHGEISGETGHKYIQNLFLNNGWRKEKDVKLSSRKKTYVDLFKPRVAIELEFSKFEMFFRDFFRFMILYQRREIDMGIIITLDEEAYKRWPGVNERKYEASRASLSKIQEFLEGEYSHMVTVPLWCIGIE